MWLTKGAENLYFDKIVNKNILYDILVKGKYTNIGGLTMYIPHGTILTLVGLFASGKSSLIEGMMNTSTNNKVMMLPTYTTRLARNPTEVNGKSKEYRFVNHSNYNSLNQINWQGLTTLSDDTVRKFKVNNVLVQKIFDEQKILVTKRMEDSSLPLEKILNPEGIFAEEGWVISKNNDQYTLEHNEHDSVPITFKEVKREVAQAFHNDLHYIHTSRVWKAYGFFLPDEDLPFSVLAIEPVDRTYKKNTLLLFGYDPRHCMEFTRLYSWPGVPKNVTSAIFGAMFSHLRKHEPRVEAAISAFMPTYASGLSMLTGGFEHPIMIKQGVHYFSPKNISGFLAMEHITNRRKEPHTISASSKLPLLPTIELIAPMKRPRFEPFLQTGTHMIEI